MHFTPSKLYRPITIHTRISPKNNSRSPISMQLQGSLGTSSLLGQSRHRPSHQCQCSKLVMLAAAPQHAAACRTQHHRVVACSSSSSSGSSGDLADPTTSSSTAQYAPPPQQQLQQQQQLPEIQQQHQQQHQQQTAAGEAPPPRKRKGSTQSKLAGWDYKYKWQPCPTFCQSGDLRCYMVEALIQNVLSYPNMPPRICKLLAVGVVTADLASMTALVESMASHFGKELTLYYVTKQPKILNLDFSTVLQRVKSFRELCGVLDSDVPMMLRKNPGLLCLEPQEMRARYDNLRELTRFNNQQMRAFVLKFPLCFAYSRESVSNSIERFRQLCFTRDEWVRSYQHYMTPSLMAYFLKDATDQLLRLEYLASTGERPEWQLRDVMKPSDKSFRAKTKNFAAWEARVKARKTQQKQAVRSAQAQQQQQAEADAIKAAILAAEEGQQQQQQWSVPPPQQQQQQQQSSPGRLFQQQQPQQQQPGQQ